MQGANRKAGAASAATIVALTVLVLAFPGAGYAQPVTGSGTAGRLSKWTSTSTIGNSLLVEAGGKLGIGSTNPAFNLEISGTTTGVLGILNRQVTPSAGGGAGVQAFITALPTAAGQRLGFSTFGVRSGSSSYNSAAIQAYSSQPWVLGSARGAYLTFETTASNTSTKSERMRIAGNGNVGIGITNPVSKLSVAGLIQSTNGGFRFPDGTVQTTAARTGDLSARVGALEAAVARLQSTVVALQSTVVGLQQTVASQQTLITTLQGRVDGVDSRIAALEGSEAMKLNQYLDVGTDEQRDLPRILFTGVNIQLVDGLGVTDPGDPVVNGLGNLILGYNEADGSEDRSGSHSLVIGPYHSYAAGGVLVAGYHNKATGQHSSVTGGADNTASYFMSSVVGGSNNSATGYSSSIAGGEHNEATYDWATVCGGTGNISGSDTTTVCGGTGNHVYGAYSSISGGNYNKTAAPNASVCGGSGNTVNTPHASVCCGEGVVQ